MKKLMVLILLLAGAFTLQKLVASGSAVESTQSPELDGLVVATFAGGCFWCVESGFEKLPGVREVISGYSGGDLKNPTYRQVSGGGTGHIESVQIYYDASTISYDQLLMGLWKLIDPTDNGGQFADRGPQYRPAVFYANDREKAIIAASLKKLQQSGRYDKPLAVDVLPFKSFYRAEEYHQDYYKKNPVRYKFYRYRSGRDQYLQKIWGDELDKPVVVSRYAKPPRQVLKEMLTPLQYKVTQEEGTEPPFSNAYWDEKRDGIYVDVTTGEPLFSSKDKFKSGTGWPSFTRPINPDSVVQKTDYKLVFPRHEVRSLSGDAHLGHVFKDGPEPTGLRYCINSASLKFIPREELREKGYIRELSLFEE